MATISIFFKKNYSIIYIMIKMFLKMEILVLDIIIGCYTQLLTISLLIGLFGYVYFKMIQFGQIQHS